MTRTQRAVEDHRRKMLEKLDDRGASFLRRERARRALVKVCRARK